MGLFLVFFESGVVYTVCTVYGNIIVIITVFWDGVMLLIYWFKDLLIQK